jgi:hypothetical protein
MEYAVYASLVVNFLTLISVVRTLLDIRDLQDRIGDLEHSYDHKDQRFEPDEDLNRRLAELQTMKFASLRRIK